jgi:hypothetical protein
MNNSEVKIIDASGIHIKTIFSMEDKLFGTEVR